MDDEVSVDLPTAIVDHGVAYGPGKGISIPRHVAAAHGLAAAKKATDPVAPRADLKVEKPVPKGPKGK